MVVTRSTARRASLIPSPMQQTSRPRVYTPTMADSYSTDLVTVEISDPEDAADVSLDGASSSLPDLTLISAPITDPSLSLCMPTIEEVTLIQPTITLTPLTPSKSRRQRLR